MRSYRIESQVDVLEVAVHAIGWYEANRRDPGPASARFARVRSRPEAVTGPFALRNWRTMVVECGGGGAGRGVVRSAQ